jgi:hypothetical protein
MGVMIFLFVIIFVFALGVFCILGFVVKKYNAIARYIEIIGYVLLVTSLFWTGMVNITSDESKGSDNLILNEKLDILWYFENHKLLDKNTNEKLKDFNQLDQEWNGPVTDKKLIKLQDDIANKISYALFALSTLFIGAGRLEELLNRRRDQ